MRSRLNVETGRSCNILFQRLLTSFVCLCVSLNFNIIVSQVSDTK